MQNFYHLLLLFFFLTGILPSHATVQLIMQCEFSNFFQDFKIQGAVGLSSQSSLMKKIHADTTIVGLLYHPSIGLYCGAMPTSMKEIRQKKSVAQVVSLMWPAFVNGMRDKVVKNYHDLQKMLDTPVENVVEEIPVAQKTAELIDMVLHDYADHTAVVQKAYEAVKGTIALATDEKQKILLQKQMSRLEMYLGKNKQKGLS